MERVLEGEVRRRMLQREREDASESEGEGGVPPRRTFVLVDDDNADADAVWRQQREGRRAEVPSSSSPAEVAGRVPAASDDDDGEPTCRICFMGDEDRENLGRLISPCLCKGTSKWVHEECLSTWRRLSTNSDSYSRCNQCRYQYRIVKDKRYDRMLNPLVLSAASALAILLGSFVLGILITSSPVDLASRLYGMLAFKPPWRRSRRPRAKRRPRGRANASTSAGLLSFLQPIGGGLPWEDMLLSRLFDSSTSILNTLSQVRPGILPWLLDCTTIGLVLVGFCGFGTILFSHAVRNQRRFIKIAAVLVIMAANIGLPFLRVLVVMGVIATATQLFHVVLVEVQKWSMQRHEKVLSIDEERSGADVAQLSPFSRRLRDTAIWLAPYMAFSVAAIYGLRFVPREFRPRQRRGR